MKLELEYRKRQQHVYNEVKKRLVCLLLRNIAMFLCVANTGPKVIYISCLGLSSRN